MGDDFVLLFFFVLPQYVKLCGKNLELQKAKHFIFWILLWPWFRLFIEVERLFKEVKIEDFFHSKRTLNFDD